MKLFSKKNKKEKTNKTEMQPHQKKCQYCDMVFDDEDRLKRHTRKAHNDKNGDMPNFNPFGPS